MFEVIEYLFVTIFALSAALYLSFLLIFRKGIKQESYPPEQTPSVTIIIPMRNEEENLHQLLNKISQLRYPENKYEILLVNDHSEDNTEKVCLSFIEKEKQISVKLINLKNPYSGKKQAIKTALNHCDSDWVLLTDADCMPQENWLTEMLSHSSNEELKMICGPVKMNGKTIAQKLFSLEFASLIISTEGAIGASLPFMANGANLAFKSEAYQSLSKDAFNENYISGEDVFLLHAFIRKYGNKSIGFAKSMGAIVSTNAPSNIKEFISQRVRWSSKAKAYRNPTATFTAIIVLTFNTLLIPAIFMAICSPLITTSLILIIALRIIIELSVFDKGLRFYGQKHLIKYYFIFMPLYPFYILYTALAGFFGNFKWKNRD